MSQAHKSWLIYSIGVFVAWAIIFLIRWKIKGTPDLKVLALVFFGFLIGWLSATIKFILISKNIHG